MCNETYNRSVLTVINISRYLGIHIAMLRIIINLACADFFKLCFQELGKIMLFHG